MMHIKKVLIGLSIFMNVLVLAVPIAYVLHGGGLIYETFVRPAHDRRESQFEKLPVQPGDIVFLGDSITEGGAWGELFPDVPVRNRGIGGDFTSGVIARLHQVTDGRPAKVFLLIGTNDLQRGVPVDEIAVNIEHIVDSIHVASPDTQIYVQSVLPRAASYRAEVEALNSTLVQRLARKAIWIDLYPVFVDEGDGSIRDDLSNDELHLLGAGYMLWRNEISELVRR